MSLASKTPASAGLSGPPGTNHPKAALYTVRSSLHPSVSRVRESRFIDLGQAQNLSIASRFADEIGLPLNQFLTIRWPAGSTPRHERKWLFELLRKWMHRAGVTFTHVWVVEIGRLSDDNCEHMHMALHVPDGLVGDTDEFVRSRLGTDDQRALKVKPVTDRAGLIRYFLKGVDPAGYKQFGIPVKEQGGQGTVVGIRCGTSRNIGRAAREAYFDAKTVFFPTSGHYRAGDSQRPFLRRIKRRLTVGVELVLDKRRGRGTPPP
jgi:hypothetical protein